VDFVYRRNQTPALLGLQSPFLFLPSAEVLSFRPFSVKERPVMDYHQKVNEARDNLDRAEKELARSTLTGPSDLAKYVRLSEAARLARKEYTDALNSLATIINRLKPNPL
jgi:hypothetical protein